MLILYNFKSENLELKPRFYLLPDVKQNTIIKEWKLFFKYGIYIHKNILDLWQCFKL